MNPGERSWHQMKAYNTNEVSNSHNSKILLKTAFSIFHSFGDVNLDLGSRSKVMAKNISP